MKMRKSLHYSVRLFHFLYVCASSLLSFLVIQDISAQELTSGTLVPAIMERVREKQAYAEGTLFLHERDFSVLEPYFRDPDVYVRRQAMRMARNSAEYTSSTMVKQRYIETALFHAFDQETYGPSVKVLQSFLPEHFSSKARAMLGEHLTRAMQEYKVSQTNENRERLNGLILCTAAACAIEHLDLLKEIKKNFGTVFENLQDKYKPVDRYMQKVENPWFDQPAWTAVRARAMMGVKDDMEFCIQLVSAFPDPEMKGRLLFEDLRKIERSEVVVFFYKSLNDDTGCYNDAGRLRSVGEMAAESLLYMIDDKAISSMNRKTPDLAKKIRSYIDEKVGGDPNKLLIRDARGEYLSSCYYSAIMLRKQKGQVERASVTPMQNTDSGETAKSN